MLGAVRHFLIGNPLASSQAYLERLGIPLALVIVSANALSSVAYASEEIFIVLNVGNETGRSYALFITLAIVVLLLVVVFSYSHVIRAYPTGGGAYVVVKENLGTTPGIVAGASLLVDYVLTVSVSVTAGAAALISAFPGLAGYQTVVAITLVGILTVINLRGIRQSAQFLALPVYLFIGSFLIMIAMGMFRYISEGPFLLPSQQRIPSEVNVLGLFLLLRAFSSGCVALTGIEAISNTMGIFRPPETRNARITLLIMGLLLAFLFLGVSALAAVLNIDPTKGETLVSQVAKASLGGNALYYVVQLSTLFILVVAANTSFAAFPQISSRLAADSFLPKPLANLGDRLVFSNGVLLLAGLSILLILFFQGNTHRLLPLYAIGVFIGFSLTQAGMAVHWWRRQGRNWIRAFLTNGFGACVTGMVLLVIAVGKFALGAWMVGIAIPLMLLLFIAIRRHYHHVAEALSLEHYVSSPPGVGNVVIVPIGGVNRSVLPAIEYAQRIGTKVRVVHIASDEDGARVTQHRWARLQNDIPLIVIPSPYREVVGPLVSYIMEVVKSHPSEYVTVVIPEFVPKRWWQRLLHNQTALFLKFALYFERRVIVTNVPYHLPK